MKQLWIVAVLGMASGVSSAVAQDIAGAHDSDQPIEITADSLEVMQQENQAVFAGNVVATQGGMKLTSDKMIVHYRNTQDKETNPDAQSVSKIEVVGNVFLATPDESARSRTGLYDVDGNVISLHDQVVLTRGENVVKGAHLQYDLVTGKSQIVGAGVTVNPESVEQNGKKGRVRGLFVPQSK